MYVLAYLIFGYVKDKASISFDDSLTILSTAHFSATIINYVFVINQNQPNSPVHIEQARSLNGHSIKKCPCLKLQYAHSASVMRSHHLHNIRILLKYACYWHKINRNGV